jgi:hypothetical protein
MNKMDVELINGSRIFFRGGAHQKGALLTGDNYKMVAFCEFANLKNGLYIYENNIQPTLARTGGTVIFESAYYRDGDDFDLIRRRAEEGEHLRDEHGRPIYYNCVFTPVDYATPDWEWDQEVRHTDDRAALAQQYYQLRGWVSLRNSIVGHWIQNIEYKDNLLDRSAPVFAVWDIGGSCNTAIWLMQYAGAKDPPRFIKLISGNRKTDPQQCTIYYLEKVRDYLGDCPYVIHVTPHDSTSRKNLDHVMTPFDYLTAARARVYRAPRASSKFKAIGSMIEYMSSHAIDYDNDAATGVHSLKQVRWKETNGVSGHEPEASTHLDGFDAFMYAILLLNGKYQMTPESLVACHYPQYRWPHVYYKPAPFRPRQPSKGIPWR